METIQVVMDAALLEAADRAARRRRVNRSALMREALREYLKRLAVQERERHDRDGYSSHPADGFAGWDKVAAWPVK